MESGSMLAGLFILAVISFHDARGGLCVTARRAGIWSACCHIADARRVNLVAMDENLAAQFEANRQRLQSVAYRMLGSLTEAEDAVQETWMRLSRSDPDSIDNLGGWLTTVLSRVCLGVLRSRRSRHEEPIVGDEPDPNPGGPEEEVLLAETLGPALLMVLDSLGPAERLAFVLHDLFAVPFEDIAPIVDRSAAAARQLASRARRRIQGIDDAYPGDRRRQQEIVEAFLAASRRPAGGPGPSSRSVSSATPSPRSRSSPNRQWSRRGKSICSRSTHQQRVPHPAITTSSRRSGMFDTLRQALARPARVCTRDDDHDRNEQCPSTVNQPPM
jgi:RNA polymerase sigma factor (sigma-70 family)